LALAACASEESETAISADASDLPLPGISEEERTLFDIGDAAFETPFRPAQGLGPVYIRHSCNSCHAADGKGPGAVHKMVVMAEDGISAASDQSALPYGPTLRNQVIAGVEHGIDIPQGVANLKVSKRIPPAVFGRGYLEAIADSEIERVELEQSQRSDGISGRINRVTFESHANSDQRFHHYVYKQGNLIGRFGLKARVPTLDDFCADALQGDMGITSPMRPEEAPMPAGIEDELPGVDISIDLVNDLAAYVRLIAIPERSELTPRGQELFTASQCSVCHTPTLRTRADYPIAVLADIDAPIFSDLLLHDMGHEAADGMSDMNATSAEWKTAPLMGLRFFTTFLHDGRARTLDEAIRMHRGVGSEANSSVDYYENLAPDDRAALLDYVGRL
jgi:CxxC motif-containing protein (DUF1111 family)